MSTISTSLLAGCFEVGSPDESDQSTSTVQGDVESDTSNSESGQSESGDTDESAEDESESGSEEMSQRLASTKEVMDMLDWLKNEYPGVSWSYRSEAHQVDKMIVDMMNSIEDEENVTESEVDLLIETARDSQNIGQDKFGEYYSVHVSYEQILNSYEDRLRRNQRRGEFELLHDALDELRQYYAGRRTEDMIQSKYPVEPVVDGPVDLLMSGSSESMLVFEATYTDNSGTQTQLMYPSFEDYRDYDGLRGDQSAFEGLSGDELSNHIGLFKNPTERVSEAIVRVNRPNEDSPDMIDISGENVNSSVIYIQEYSSVNSAASAFQELIEQVTIDGEEDRWGSPWEMVLTSYNEENVYAHLAQDGKYVFAVGVSTTPWENRPTIGESESWDPLIGSTWFGN